VWCETHISIMVSCRELENASTLGLESARLCPRTTIVGAYYWCECDVSAPCKGQEEGKKNNKQLVQARAKVHASSVQEKAKSSLSTANGRCSIELSCSKERVVSLRNNVPRR
jgi:hypothetical protein